MFGLHKISRVYVVLLENGTGYPWGVFSSEAKAEQAIARYADQLERLNLKTITMTYELDYRLTMPIVKYWKAKNNVDIQISTTAVQDQMANKSDDAKV